METFRTNRGVKRLRKLEQCSGNEIPDVEGAAVGGDDDEEEAEEGEDYESDDEEIYWFVPVLQKHMA